MMPRKFPYPHWLYFVVDDMLEFAVARGWKYSYLLKNT